MSQDRPGYAVESAARTEGQALVNLSRLEKQIYMQRDLIASLAARLRPISSPAPPNVGDPLAKNAISPAPPVRITDRLEHASRELDHNCSFIEQIMSSLDL